MAEAPCQSRLISIPILKRLARGESLLLSHRGKPAARLEPIGAAAGRRDGTLYTIPGLLESGLC